MTERMITHRKYLSMVSMMAVIVVLFVFSQVAKETISNYDTNTYASRPPVSGSLRWTPTVAGGTRGDPDQSLEALPEEGRFVLLLGDEANEVGSVVPLHQAQSGGPAQRLRLLAGDPPPGPDFDRLHRDRLRGRDPGADPPGGAGL